MSREDVMRCDEYPAERKFLDLGISFLFTLICTHIK
jgi:hypothetical protein